MTFVSKRMKKMYEGFDKEKLYTISEALKVLKEKSTVKFDETVDIAIVVGDASTVNLNVEVPSTIGIGVVRKGKGYRIFHDGTIKLNGRLRKSESYSNGMWTINFPQAFDCESVVVTPELYGAVSAEIPSFAILEKTSKYCKVKASAPSEGLSWVAVGRTLDDVI